jgi:hypothetical protein
MQVGTNRRHDYFGSSGCNVNTHVHKFGHATMSADPSVAYPSYVEDGALNELRLQTLANFVHTTLARKPDPENAHSHFLLLLSSLWPDAFPTNPKNEEAKPSKSKEHKKRKKADDNIVHNMNEERMRMVVSYTTDQRGKDIRDEDVVRPKKQMLDRTWW